jgi:membrane protein implicated in regulation of membrane protease activity
VIVYSWRSCRDTLSIEILEAGVLVYAAVGAAGLLFLLVMLVGGDMFGGDGHDHAFDQDADSGGPGFLSARVIAAFMTAFGVGGVVGRYYELSHPASSGVGVAAGFGMAAIVYQFAKFLYSQQASSELRIAGLVGQHGEVTISIPDNAVGEVIVAAGGERTAHIARSADGAAIAVGTEVVITSLRGQSVVVTRAASPAKGASS